MLHVFTPPAGLEWSRPRAVRLSAAGRALAIAAIALLLSGPAAGIGMHYALPRVLPFWLPYLICGVQVGIAMLFAAILRADLRLLAEGRIAEGTVRDVKVSRSQYGTQSSVRYDFVLLSGAQMTGKTDASRTPPAIGSSLVVIYDPERPKRNKPYPFKLVTPMRQ